MKTLIIKCNGNTEYEFCFEGKLSTKTLLNIFFGGEIFYDPQTVYDCLEAYNKGNYSVKDSNKSNQYQEIVKLIESYKDKYTSYTITKAYLYERVIDDLQRASDETFTYRDMMHAKRELSKIIKDNPKGLFKKVARTYVLICGFSKLPEDK